MTRPSKIINTRTQQLIVTDLKLANTFYTRFKGLLGAKPLRQLQGLLISPCQQVHTHFMGFTIDVVFLDKQLKVLHIHRKMRPWRFSKYVKAAYYVLELAENGALNLQINDILEVQ